MAYVEKMYTEGEFQDEIVKLVIANGWKKVKSFFRAVYPDLDVKSEDDSKFEFGMSKHMLVKNNSGSIYGIAQISKWSLKKSEIKYNFTNEEGKKAFAEDGKKRLESGRDRSCFYVYMIEKEPSVVDEGILVLPYESNKFEKILLDVELTKITVTTKVSPSGSGTYKVYSYDEAETQVMMSPWVKVTLRNTNIQGVDAQTNWWPDSLVRINGQVDESRVVLLIQADNTPAFENNVVPVTPLYMGQLESYANDDTLGDALWAGTAFDTGNEAASHKFDFNDTKPYRNVENYMPVMKSYPRSPGNGIDNVIIKRSRLGARYQAHFIAWNVAPNAMPPDRVGKDGGQYSLAWQSQDNDEYKYQFNPSVYSNKVHTSRAYIVHPDEGVRGYLPYMILLSPLGLLNGDRLKVRKNTCPDSHDIYKFFNVDAISPITKRPSTAYRPAGLGIFEKTV
ncbi:hypothetical protein ACQVWH_19330 [Bacillus toyonensis]|uniref:hypothetical protein n=1 Tax=Bacillus toyonensis TaxID=155322 RepID=UPI00027968C2|nr:hypothetical protein [Bacillus toyonensis]KNH39615.1 Major virion structural protein [Bacillus thuringiensis]EJQ89455.1 hypothetical protein IGO_01951 [Bacillus toyonensis]EOP43500.1 hypothetical protein IKI_01390 [Bacillus toyonensis]HDR7224163.1 hypothetical protein [Bacillus toyonensis]HDR7349050.1 hypothetical protein [Bacillus toyonensis]